MGSVGAGMGRMVSVNEGWSGVRLMGVGDHVGRALMRENASSSFCRRVSFKEVGSMPRPTRLMGVAGGVV